MNHPSLKLETDAYYIFTMDNRSYAYGKFTGETADNYQWVKVITAEIVEGERFDSEQWINLRSVTSIVLTNKQRLEWLLKQGQKQSEHSPLN